jgi:hypothetical protein
MDMRTAHEGRWDRNGRSQSAGTRDSRPRVENSSNFFSLSAFQKFQPTLIETSHFRSNLPKNLGEVTSDNFITFQERPFTDAFVLSREIGVMLAVGTIYWQADMLQRLLV